ncbi:Rpn family recombination-promoting nuclease/putative transposase [Candidatus Parabeggiatoa sp. HSG14]|uniref:Rpn family recombination-promoting nuclease/putative transposase n=1 Tax=Candidatus Parabeggiatoa sp. HSG14 TaxID=3055593 RepID=UPI0025A7F36D|nr:Rpn family recombination-promoting nuclease/putative transposase [Thiotrichales bacterium HSG14]
MEIGRLKYDVLFKKVFYKKHLLKAFLNTVLKQELSSPITDISYEPTDFIIEGKSLLVQKSKHDVIDVFCITQQKERILIELQKGYNKRALPRFLDYQCRNYSSQFRTGSDYTVVVPCYSICWFFDMKPPHKKVKETITLSSNCKKTDWHFEWKIIALYPQNIPKSHLEQQKIDQLEEWLLLDIIEDMEISQEIQQFFNTQEVKEAFETLDLSELSEEQLRRMMFEEEITKGYSDLYEEKIREAEKKTKKETEKEQKLAIAKNMLSQKMSIKIIAQLTGLSKDEITALIKE